MRRFRSVLIAITALGAAACARHAALDVGAATRAPMRSMPSWYRTPPRNDAEWILAPATATSKDLQMAMDRAEMEGRLGIATQMEVKYGALTRRFAEETGLGREAELLREYEQTYKAVVSQVLVGSRARERQFALEDGVYRAWVLMELPIGEASRKLMDRLRENEAAWTRLRATEAYRELNAEVEKYEASRARRP